MSRDHYQQQVTIIIIIMIIILSVDDATYVSQIKLMNHSCGQAGGGKSVVEKFVI